MAGSVGDGGGPLGGLQGQTLATAAVEMERAMLWGSDLSTAYKRQRLAGEQLNAQNHQMMMQLMANAYVGMPSFGRDVRTVVDECARRSPKPEQYGPLRTSPGVPQEVHPFWAEPHLGRVLWPHTGIDAFERRQRQVHEFMKWSWISAGGMVTLFVLPRVIEWFAWWYR